MNSLIQAFSKFLGRDIPYILGGASVILAALYLFGIPLNQKLETPYILLIAGISYVIGYAIHEGISFTPIASTSLSLTPNHFLKWLFKKWGQQQWTVPEGYNAWEQYFQAYANLSKDALDPIERIITLQHVGITMGTNWLIVSLILLVKTIVDLSIINVCLLISVSILSMVLLLLGWLQGMEKMLALYQLKNKLSKLAKEAEQTGSDGPR